MALFRKIFYRKPPDGLLEISDRVFVFDCCFTTDILEDDDYKLYIGGIVGQLHECFPDASYMVFNFGKGGEQQSQISDILSQFDMIVMDYPRQYENCPLLPMEMIHHFLRSSENWLSLGKMNVLLMHCDNGGLPILVFMLAALLIYRKQYTGEKRTLDMIYKQAPFQLLQMLSPLNPLPSQLRYLQYVSRRNVGSQWPPLDRALTLDCIILRLIPNMDGEGGCRPIFRIYGQDPFMAADRTTKVLFSMPKKSRVVRHFKQADCELVKIDINCHVQGDVVLECITLDGDLDHEEMMFRVMFNTAFIRSNILMLNRDEIDVLWDIKDQFPKDFTAEVLFSDMDSSPSLAGLDLTSVEDKEGLPIEAFAKIQEIFNSVDWLEPKTEAALNILETEILQEKLEIVPLPIARMETLENGFTQSEKNELLESALLRAAIEKKLKCGFLQRINDGKLEIASFQSVQKEIISVSSNGVKYVGLQEMSHAIDEETKKSKEFENDIKSSVHATPSETPLASSKSSLDLNLITKKVESQEVQVSVQRRRESNIISPRNSQNSQSNPATYSSSLQGSPVALSRFHSAPSILGITELLHDQVTQSVTPQVSISASIPSLLKPAQLNSSSLPSGQLSFNSEMVTKASPPLPPTLTQLMLSTQSTPGLLQPPTPSQPNLKSPTLQLQSACHLSSSQPFQTLSSQVPPPSSLQPSPPVPPAPWSFLQSTPPPPLPPPPKSSCHLSPSDPSTTFTGDTKISGQTEQKLHLDLHLPPLFCASISSPSSNLNPVSIPLPPPMPPFSATALPPSLRNLLPAPSLPSPAPHPVSGKVGSPFCKNKPSSPSPPLPPSLQNTPPPPPPSFPAAATRSLQNTSSAPSLPSPFSVTAASPSIQKPSSPPPSPPFLGTAECPLPRKKSTAPLPPPPPPLRFLGTDGSLFQRKPSSGPIPPLSFLSQTNIPSTLRNTSLAPPHPPPPSPPSSSSSGSTVQNSSACFLPAPHPLSRTTSSTTSQDSFLLRAEDSALPATPPPLSPPPCSRPTIDSTIRLSAASPALPQHPCSGSTTVSTIRSSAAPPAPPPPPCSRPTTVSTIRSSAAPPALSPPSSIQEEAIVGNSQNVPPVPPPPAPLSNGLSIAGSASSQSNSAANNKSIPAPPFCTKGRLPMRASTKIQGQGRKTSLKPYHWLKLTRAIQGSLWADAQKPEEASKAPELDMSELESLFSASAPNSNHGGASGKTNRLTSGLKSDKVHLIELRRAYNCEIMLTKVKVPMSDLTNSILIMDDSALDIDQVDNLIKFSPTKEEMELLKNYNGDKENLGKCEQFFLELMKVPRVESKLRVFSFKIQFCSQVSELRNSLNIVNSASEEVRNSIKLKRIMQTILSLGNALNHGTARGSAVGFRLDSLLKLTETRARNKKLTLMHYLCKNQSSVQFQIFLSALLISLSPPL
ncbi:formin-like protein 18 isoform X3 [Olea europaea var. sylvestris]|uniref:formin-like protein 18 isoform X3 n=1 Tax=Olea europaea var. sylvestris TaxID=158386 RepID=UPI000C1D6B1C|nr:formin-like protein 18 isoform X3 [Olea europaea var. sylvestris]